MLFFLAMTLLATLPVACNKEDKERLADLEGRLTELENSVVGIPESPDISSHDLSVSFDDGYCWVDAAGSVTLHYNLSRPANVEVFAEEGWAATVSGQGEREGSIVVSAPDPASPSVLRLKLTDSEGCTAESFIQIHVRKPYCNVAGPRIETMAYNGFSDALATEENFQKLVEAGITMLSVEGDYADLDWRHQCRLAEKYGIKVVLFIGYSSGCYFINPENDTILENKIREAETYPAVCAYQITDEPSTYEGPSLALSRRKIAELAPEHPTYINLRPGGGSQEGMGASTYEEYVEYYASVCDLEFLTFDQYPVYLSGVEDEWYHSLEVISSTARRHGIPFWAFLLCCREWYRADPTLENIRLQGNMNLTYGAQCIQFFVWKATSGTNYAPIMNDGEYKPVYYDCKEYNRELHNREFVFAHCNVRGVRHIGNNYYLHGACLTEADLPEAISGISADGAAAVSFLGNNGNEYVVVCNKSWQDKLNVDLTFTREVYTIDRDGVFAEQQPGTSTFVIDEGDMLVVKWL